MMRSGPRVLGVIPAKGKSRGVPKKNIRPLCGLPLIAYTILNAKKSKMLTRVVVSTESNEVIKIAKEYGADVLFKRPKKLAQHSTKMLPVIQHAVRKVEKEEGRKYDFVVILQPTAPFRTASDIDRAVRKLIKTGADSVISVCEVGPMHPARMKRIVDDKLVDIFPEIEGTLREELEPIYIRNGAIYAVKRDTLMNQNTIRGKVSRPYVMPPERSVNIDTLLDFKLAEALMKEMKQSDQDPCC